MQESDEGALQLHPSLFDDFPPVERTAAPSEECDALAALHMTQVGASKVLGIGERTSRRFALDGDVPWYIEVLLNVMVAKAVPVREIIKAPDYEQLPRPAAQLFHLIAIGRVRPREVLAIGFRPGRKGAGKIKRPLSRADAGRMFRTVLTKKPITS